MNSRLTTQILAVLGFRLLLNTVRRFVYPFAPALSRNLEVPLAAVTSIIATIQLSTFFGLLSGLAADRLGDRLMMRTGLALAALGMLLCGIFPSYWWVFVGLVLAGLGKTIFDPAIQAFVGRHVPYERRGRIVGIIETAWAGSTLVGIPLMGLIIANFGLAAVFYLLAFLGGLSWFAVGWVIPEEQPASPAGGRRKGMLASILQLVRIRPAAGMLLFGFWISIANDSLFVVYGAWFEQAFLVSIVALGFSTVAIGAAELLGESLTALFADRIGLKRALISGLLLLIGAYLALPLIGVSLSAAMVGMFLVFLCFEFVIVSSFSLSTELLPGARATMMGGFYATAGLGRMVGVLMGGVLWQWGGIVAVTTQAAVLTLFGLLSLLWGLHGWRRQEVPELD
ncbi:MAG: MFS transporter [Desulforhopalus sp.]|jgi:predicted MFS family arabinose efflux permease|nr:MFS transporter [Desulforhopalus sp.]